MVSSTPRPYFTSGKNPAHILQEAGWAPGPVWTGGKSRPHRDSIPDPPAHSQSLYRLSFPAHILYIYIYIYILYIYIYIYIYILCINYRKDQKCMTFPQCQAFLISLEIPLFHKAVDPESNCCQHGYAIDIHPLSSETKTHPSVSPPSPGLRIWLSLTVVYFNSSQSYTT